MKDVRINKINEEDESAGNAGRVFSFFGLQLCISSKRYCSEDGVNNYLLSYSLFFKVNKGGIPLYRKKTRGFKIVKKGRHVWGGAFSRTQTFKRIAE